MIYGLPLKGEVKPRVMEYAIAAMVSPGTVARDAITGKGGKLLGHLCTLH